VSALSEALSAANKSGLSARAVSRIARERGHSLNHDTAARYLRGDHGQPDEATLVAFADVLHMSLSTLRRAAGLPADETAPYTPPPESSRLTRRQRRAVDEIIRAMLDPGRSVADLASRRRAAGPRAARHGDVDRNS
jgi:transcriptional regulator with XRE-family HTH domain